MCEVPDVCRRCNALQSNKVASCKDYADTCGKKPCRGFGSNVVVQHDDTLFSHYVHLDTVADGIAKGSSITKGQLIGTVGNTGVSQGRHLHFGIYNEWPKRKTGDPKYPESGRNPFCYFPDAILTQLNVHRTNCPTMYGGSGQIVSSVHPRVVEDCKQADLSALKRLSPTPMETVPESPPSGQPQFVQVCRPTTAAPTEEGMVSGDAITCRYCNAAKETLKSINSQEYASCISKKSVCCEGPCPPNSIVKDIDFISQCGPEMGPGGNCWHDGVAPEAGPGQGENYCSSACGVAVTRMALDSFGVQKTSQDLFCGGPDSVYQPGGSRAPLIESVAKNAGLENSKVNRDIDWEDIVKNVKEGKVIAFHLDDRRGGGGNLERSKHSDGHFILLHGANTNYIIANDPGRRSPRNAENIVLSQQYVERVGRSYTVIG
jgi:hypothetical protein